MANSMAALCVLAVVMTLVAVPAAHAQCDTTLLQAVADDPNLAELAKLIIASNLAIKFNETDYVTVLAPNNEAFNGTNGLYRFLEQNGVTIGDIAGQTSNSNNRAGSIILYHILQDSFTTELLTDGESYLTSLNGYSLTADKTTTSVTFIGNANDATVVTADASVCNSVVHVVNAVLLPSSDLTAIPVYYDNFTPTPGVGENGASGLSIGAWVFALSGALAAALMM